MPIAEAFVRVTGTRPHPSTCWRWYRRGIKGIKLDTWIVCGKRMTTTEAARRFVEETTAATDAALDAQMPEQQDKPRKLTKQDERAVARLNRKLGLVS
ncbi:MAG: hypothetical protein Aurels2KO_10650 [Aureliella sp.]